MEAIFLQILLGLYIYMFMCAVTFLTLIMIAIILLLRAYNNNQIILLQYSIAYCDLPALSDLCVLVIGVEIICCTSSSRCCFFGSSLRLPSFHVPVNSIIDNL